MSEPNVTDGHAQLNPWRSEQPVVRTVALATPRGHHVFRAATLQHGHHIGRNIVQRRV